MPRIKVHIEPSARRHGVADDAITHAVRHHLMRDDMILGGEASLFLGPDTAGNLIEVIGAVDDDTLYAFHAMPARPKFVQAMTRRWR